MAQFLLTTRTEVDLDLSPTFPGSVDSRAALQQSADRKALSIKESDERRLFRVQGQRSGGGERHAEFRMKRIARGRREEGADEQCSGTNRRLATVGDFAL